MKKVKVPEWNQPQLQIALELSQGKEVQEIIAEGKFKQGVVYKIAAAIKAGYQPPSLDEAYIVAAPQPTKFGTGKKPKEIPVGVTPSKDESKGDKGGKSKKNLPPYGLLKLVGTVVNSEYTPIMHMAREAAAEQWNWPINIRFEDFIDTILYHFFKDRGITLQGYIVDEEVEAK